ncbi:MAG: glutamine-hydrolyzing carbamoyl-phosphate synthase small subunit, partial [Candidatus Diapherotrites archaeon]
TYPMIGNYGVPSKEKKDGMLKNFESDKIQVAGVVVLEYSYNYSHSSAVRSLADWLKEENIPAITGIDTRALTQKLRDKGVMLGKLIIGDTDSEKVKLENPNKRNLVAEASCKKVTEYKAGKKRIAMLDCGTKNNIIRSLIRRDVTVLKVPWDYDLLGSSEKFHGIMISNGPGDPKMADKTIETVKEAMEKEIPIFGICMGNQILGLAAGGDTYKLKFGHRSQNQPCIMEGTERCYITSQNHGYALSVEKLPKEWKPWFINANDGTNEGIIHKTKPFMSVQFHPEATPGAVDTEFLFELLLKKVKL